MSTKTINQFPALSTLALADVLPIYDVSASPPRTRQVTLTTLRDFIVADYLTAAAAAAAYQPLDADLTALAALATTVFGRSLLTETSAATLKGTLSLGNVENTAISTWAGSSNLTTLGTIATGTWQGTAIADGYIASAATWNAKQNALTAGVDYLAPTGNGSGLTGLTKSQVGLGSVPNTDATARASHTGTQLASTISDFSAAALLAVTWSTLTGKPSTFTPAVHASAHQSGGGDPIKLDDLATPDDNSDLNASTTRHGLLRKLSNVATEFLNGAGNWATPAGGGGGSSAPFPRMAWVHKTLGDNTTGNGSEAAPFATLQHAFDQGFRALAFIGDFATLEIGASAATTLLLYGFGNTVSILTSLTSNGSTGWQILGNGPEAIRVDSIQLFAENGANAAEGESAPGGSPAYDSTVSGVYSAGGTWMLLGGSGGTGGQGGVIDDYGQAGGAGGAGGSGAVFRVWNCRFAGAYIYSENGNGGNGGAGGSGANSTGAGGNGGDANAGPGSVDLRYTVMESGTVVCSAASPGTGGTGSPEGATGYYGTDGAVSATFSVLANAPTPPTGMTVRASWIESNFYPSSYP